jgi:hypothetical protein
MRWLGCAGFGNGIGWHYWQTVSTSKNGINNVDTLFVKLRPIRYGRASKIDAFNLTACGNA